jgi:hypothetical protein
LESGKVTDKLEDPENPGDANETKNFSGFSDDVELREVIDQEGDKVGQDGKQVDLVFSIQQILDFCKMWNRTKTSF